MKRKTRSPSGFILPKGVMRPRRLLILLIMLAASWVVSKREQAPFRPDADSTRSIVVKVIDGDTVRMSNNETIRLLGIDAPEIPKTRSGKVIELGGYYSRQATDLLADWALNKEVILYPEEPLLDNYNRRLAEFFTPEGQSLNERMVAEGAATVYIFSSLNAEQKERLIRAQKRAMRERRGFWPKLFSLPKSALPVVANKNSKRFFPAGCSGAKNVAPQNKINFSSAIDAFEEGYSPDRNCGFWPTE